MLAVETAADQARAEPARRPHVVILGAGFGGLNAALGLRNAPVDVTVIDRRNYHLFQPLLYQVATAGLSPAQIATPIRRILARPEERDGADGQGRGRRSRVAQIVTTANRRIPYDYLIVATGARHAYFGHDEWEETAPGLKTIDDATEIRARILTAFERAEVTEDPELRRSCSPSSSSAAGRPASRWPAPSPNSRARRSSRDFRNIDSRQRRVVLVEAGPRLLPHFPESLSQSAKTPAREARRRGAARRRGDRDATKTA